MAIDLARLLPAQLDRFIHIQSLLARQQIDAAKVRVLRDYYDGSQTVMLSDRQIEFIGKMLTEGEFEFAHNATKSVIDTLRERLSVSGFHVNGAALDDDSQDSNTPEAKLAALFWAWWEENRYDAQQIRLHRRALRDGKSYVMVDFDSINNRPRFTLQAVDDGTTGVQLHRSPENPEEILFVNKYFYTFNPLEPGKTGIERKTTYLPDQIRKYIRGGPENGWQQYADEDGGVWPIPWRDSDGQPLGIPIIEFENPGGSEVAQIMGLQDGLNKSWLDLIAAADAAGFPILAAEYDVIPGVTPVADQEDDANIEGDDEFIVAPGRMLTIDGGKFHRIEGANLEQLIAVIWTFVMVIAAVSRTPQHFLQPMSGDFPSGEALKQSEVGLVSRAKERQLIFGQGWADVMAMAYKLQRVFGTGTIPEVDRLKIATTWADPETRNEAADAQTAQLHQTLGVPDTEVFARLGYSPQEIRTFMATRRSDQAAQVATIAQALQARPTTPQPGARTATPAGTEAAPENISSTEGLNGIQIRSAVELLDKVSRGEIDPDIAVELITSLGIERGRAEKMVANAKNWPATAVPAPTVTNARNGGAA